MDVTDQIPLRELLVRTRPLDRAFYARPTVEVAQSLLGKILIHSKTAGVIRETEAYLGVHDQAAHAFRGRTRATEVIFGPPGRAYVYLIYGMYECLNIVAEPDGAAGCVLIRAIDPICGIAEMIKRRPKARRLEDLASGPGKLTLAMGITRRDNGRDITRGPLAVRKWIDERPVRFDTTPRIGISRCADWPLRYVLQTESRP